jgi:hypothetical protein
MLETNRIKIKKKLEKLVQLVEKMRCGDDTPRETSTKASVEIVSEATLPVRSKEVHKIVKKYAELMLITKIIQMK